MLPGSGRGRETSLGGRTGVHRRGKFGHGGAGAIRASKADVSADAAMIRKAASRRALTLTLLLRSPEARVSAHPMRVATPAHRSGHFKCILVGWRGAQIAARASAT